MIYSIQHKDKTAYIFVSDPDDYIQSHLLSGEFYESKELEEINSYLINNEIIIDIGANIGNHSIFWGLEDKVKMVYPIEPNPEAIDQLYANINLNKDAKIDTSLVGYAWSSSKFNELSLYRFPGNLGATRHHANGNINVKTISGDQALKEKNIIPTFIKIDVEQHELEVLDGLKETINKHRPKIFIEVDNENLEKFINWVDNNDYIVLWNIRRYSENINLFLTPAPKS